MENLMSEKNKIQIVIPEGLSWPDDKPIPEIKVKDCLFRRVKRTDEGKLFEEETIVPLPILSDED